MDIGILPIALALVLLGLVAVIVFLVRKQSSGSATGLNADQLMQQIHEMRRDMQSMTSQGRQEVQSRLDHIQKELTSNLTESQQSMQRHFAQSATVIRDVTEKMTTLDSTNKQILGFSEQLTSLESILKNPKHRGILGEYWLETLLSQVLQPTQYKMQYDLGIDGGGARLVPDAVIFIRDMIIPIDSKFSLENYNKIMSTDDPALRESLERDFKSDVKKRIDETSKYINPEKGTTNFAFMFVPAEGVYHNLVSSSVGAVNVNTRSLIEYAFEKGVVIVAPTSFFAYLQTVIMGLKALKIEESVKEIQRRSEELMRHLKAYEDYHNKLGKHIETTMRVYSSSSNELKKIDKDIYRISEGRAGKLLTPLAITREETLDEIQS
ncbi:DNA recombination protein RmuC [Candidatus Uhrbacteria bacterium]|nr:DNA recombination protein RmuC [Candidatus Uhrbacteria bacterium]